MIRKSWIGNSVRVGQWVWQRPPLAEILYIRNYLPISTKFGAQHYPDILMLQCENGQKSDIRILNFMSFFHITSYKSNTYEDIGTNICTNSFFKLRNLLPKNCWNREISFQAIGYGICGPQYLWLTLYRKQRSICKIYCWNSWRSNIKNFELR